MGDEERKLRERVERLEEWARKRAERVKKKGGESKEKERRE